MRRSNTELLLTEPNIYKAFFILALPVFGANFMKAFNEFVDTVFIGQIADSVSAQAGIAIAWPLMNLFLSFQVGFGVAGVAIISQLLGGRKKMEAVENAGVLLTVAVILGVVLNILMFLFAPLVIGLMGAEGEVFVCGTQYLQVRSFELTFTFIFAAFQAIRQAQGDTVTPVVLSVGAVVGNIILTAIFVRGLGMGVVGAALATVIGNIVIAPICLFLMFSSHQSLYITRENLKVKKEIFLRMSKIAMPAACSQSFSALGFIILQALILAYGANVAAAFSVGNRVTNMLLMPGMALGSVLAAYVGQNIGAHNSDRAKKAYLVSRNMGLAIAIVGALIIMPLRAPLVQFLSNDPGTQVAAVEYMFWALLTQPLMALFQNYLGVFNGSGNTKYAMIMAVVRLWVLRLPVLWLFSNFTAIGEAGVWHAMNISNFLILILGAVLLRRVKFVPRIATKAQEV